MPQSDGFNIFHMSDLHFNGKNLELLKIVLHHLVESAPRYVFITGDLVEGPGDDLDIAVTMIRNALREVERFAGFRPELKVVPGNHDFFYKGTYGWRRTWKFYRLFTKQERSHGFSPEDMIAIATFDSNQILEPRGSIWRKSVQLMRAMSHGLIIERDLDAFSEWTRQLRRSPDGERYVQSFKVALLHHHPMPTKYSFLPRMADEAFMMLENAGALLYRLIQEDFDLIIHGHRHYPQFCRAVYKNQDGKSGRWGSWPAALPRRNMTTGSGSWVTTSISFAYPGTARSMPSSISAAAPAPFCPVRKGPSSGGPENRSSARPNCWATGSAPSWIIDDGAPPPHIPASFSIF